MEKNYILIRYAEIALKKKNRSLFEKYLINNIKQGLKNNLIQIKRYPGRIIIKVRNVEEAKKVLSRIFGIKSFSPAIKYEFKNLQDIANLAERLFKDLVYNKTFKVECNRVGNHNFSSYDVKKEIGAILSKYGTVDIKNPEIIVYIEIRDNEAYYFNEIIKGPGGLPLGVEGKTLALVSGGFDSPVAAWYIMRRGAYVDIFYCNLGEELEEYYVLNVIKKLKEWSIGYNFKIYVARCYTIIKKLLNIDTKCALVVFRRILYKIAEDLSERIGAKAIVTGESLGQKSSQTLHNLYAAEYGIKIPIFRPLIGFDKDEIIKKSRELGFYSESEKTPEFCSLMSKQPSTKCSKEEVLSIFEKIEDYLKSVKIDVYDSTDLDNIIEKLKLRINTVFRIPEDINNFKIIDANKVKNLEELKRYKKIILYCKTGATAYIIAKQLREKGVEAYAISEKALKETLNKCSSNQNDNREDKH